MLTNRRDFMFSIGSLAAMGLFPRIATAIWPQQSLHFANKQLRGGAYVIGELSSGGNVLAMPTEAGPVMIDSKHAHSARNLSQDFHALVKTRPTLLINTHHHADHTGGNWKFSNTAKVVAHKNLNARIQGNLQQYAQQAQGYVATLKESNADETAITEATALAGQIKDFKAEQFKANDELQDGVTIINHGGVELHCHHFGNGHTDNDVVIFIPKHNIMHMGDLLFHKLYPFIDRSAKADTVGWQNSLRKAMELGDDQTIVIPGHGEVTDKTALPKQIEFFDQLREIVSNAIKEGKSKEGVMAMKPDAFSDIGFDFIRPRAMGGMYEELQEKN